MTINNKYKASEVERLAEAYNGMSKLNLFNNKIAPQKIEPEASVTEKVEQTPKPSM